MIHDIAWPDEMVGALQQVLVPAMLTPGNGEARDRTRRGLVGVDAHRRDADAIQIGSTDVIGDRTKRMLPVLPALRVAFQ